MSFFGPGSLLSGYEPSPPGGLDPALYKALMAAFPGLQSLGGQQGQQSASLQSLGYQGQGPQFFQGQGSGSFQNLTPFEGAKGFGAESITGGLASGTIGKSQSQQAPTGSGLLSLPQLQLPQALAAQQGAYGQADMGAMGGGEQQGGITIGAGDVLGAGQQLYDLFGGGPTLGTQTQTPGYQAYRQGERTDYSTATGSPSGLPQSLQGMNLGALNPSLVPTQSLPSDTTFSTDMSGFGAVSPTLQSQYNLPSDTTFSMPGAGEAMMAPGGSAQTALGQPTDWLGAAQGGLGVLGGVYNLYGGVQGGDVGSSIGGGLQAIGGGASLLQSTPGLASTLGLSSDVLGAVGAGAGGLGGLLSLAQGIQSGGDPVQIATGLYSMLPAINALAGTQAGASALASIGLGALPTATSAGSGLLGAAAPILSAASLYALPVAFIVQALTDSIAHMERSRVMNAGFTNNPVAGQLYSNATAGVGSVNEMLGGLGDLSGQSTWELGQALSGGANALMPYYATAPGGRGPLRASDTITGMGGFGAAKPYEGGQTPEEYTANFTRSRQGITGLVQELMNRGVTYEQLGQLPISGDWAQQSLDAGNDPFEMFARNYATGAPGQAETRWAEGLRLASARGMAPTEDSPFGGAESLLHQALGASMKAPADVSKASGLMTQMYGGPLWAAIARMGAPELMPLINQNFDPWVNARRLSPELYKQHVAAEQAGDIPADAYQALMAGWDVDSWERAKAGQKARQDAIAAQMAPPAQPDFWGPLGQQWAQQNDPATQAIQQYIQQLGQFQGQLPQLTQAAQMAPTQGLDAGALAALQPQGPSGFSGAPNTGGGMNQGMDLMALLRQMGYAV